MSHFGHFSADDCAAGLVISPCTGSAMRVTVLSLFLSIISIAASVGIFQAVAFRKIRTVAATGFCPWSRSRKMQVPFPLLGTPSCKGRSLRHAVLIGITPAPRSSIPHECQENNTSEMMESKSSGLPVLLSDCFVSSVTSCYGC